jgi:DNA polymerase III alpha subunit (gram-positive type)
MQARGKAKTVTLDYTFGSGTFCVLDIETTGLSTEFHEITEIAAIRVNERFEVVAEMSSLVKISSRVPWHITNLTGITDGMLRSHGRELPEVVEEFHGFLGGEVMFAHNASFDRRFMNTAALRTGLAGDFPLRCSIPVFKKQLPGRKGYGLPVLAEALKVKGGGEHRALGDCRVLLECLRRVH